MNTLILALELIGTVAFAASGALTGLSIHLILVSMIFSFSFNY